MALPEALEVAVLATVTEQYALWKQGRLREEPRITAALLREWVPRDVSPAWHDIPKKKQTALVEAALARLKTKGKLKTSTGVGLDGREARLWEPV